MHPFEASTGPRARVHVSYLQATKFDFAAKSAVSECRARSRLGVDMAVTPLLARNGPMARQSAQTGESIHCESVIHVYLSQGLRAQA